MVPIDFSRVRRNSHPVIRRLDRPQSATARPVRERRLIGMLLGLVLLAQTPLVIGQEPPTSAISTHSPAPTNIPINSAPAAFTANSPVAKAISPAPGVLMLRNGNILRGQISLLGDRYLVALDSQNEVRIPASDVELHCESLLHAYQFRRSKLPPGQVSARIDLAEWCLRLGLVKQAADEATFAMRLEPDHPRLGPLEQRITSAASPPSSAKSSEPTAASPATVDQLEQSARELPFGAMERFTASIQPMLLNRCGTNNCHGPGSNSDFHMLRPSPGQTSTRRFTLRNLHATLQAIDRDAPDESSLLKMSREAHGPLKTAPMREGEQVQYEQLAQWVRQITQPKLVNSPVTIGRPGAQLLQTTQVPGGKQGTGDASPPVSTPNPPAQRTETANSPPAQDPFDPEVFNRRYLPAKSAPELIPAPAPIRN